MATGRPHCRLGSTASGELPPRAGWGLLTREETTSAAEYGPTEGCPPTQVDPDQSIGKGPQLRGNLVDVVAVRYPAGQRVEPLLYFDPEHRRLKGDPTGLPPDRVQLHVCGGERNSRFPSQGALSRTGPTHDDEPVHPLRVGEWRP